YKSDAPREQCPMEVARSSSPPICAGAHPCDASSVGWAVDAARLGLFRPILIGPQERIDAVAEEPGLNLPGPERIDTPHSHASADKAVECVQSARASLLMKGKIGRASCRERGEASVVCVYHE